MKTDQFFVFKIHFVNTLRIFDWTADSALGKTMYYDVMLLFLYGDWLRTQAPSL